jgi:hypothetical protein
MEDCPQVAGDRGVRLAQRRDSISFASANHLRFGVSVTTISWKPPCPKAEHPDQARPGMSESDGSRVFCPPSVMLSYAGQEQ